MRTIVIFIAFQLLFSYNSFSQKLDAYPFPHPEGYVCYQVENQIKVDGILDEKSWESAPWTKYFADIEGDKKPAPYHLTRAKMLWDKDYFYIAAELEEPHVWGKLRQRDTVIFYDNDFEVFIDPDGDNHMYYEFEMNALNTVWDLMLVKPYRDGGPAIDSWDINGLKTAVKIYGTLNNPSDKDEKWTLEIAFPWSVLEEAASHNGAPKDGEQWRVSFSRVQWETEIKNNQYVKKVDENGKRLPENNWTWPQQGKINMHRPETWGYVQFSENVVGTVEEAFNKDQYFDAKMALMEVYYQQKDYYKSNGNYTQDINKLKLSEFNQVNFGKEIEIEIGTDRFKASIKKESVVWSVNEESKLTSKKF